MSTVSRKTQSTQKERTSSSLFLSYTHMSTEYTQWTIINNISPAMSERRNEKERMKRKILHTREQQLKNGNTRIIMSETAAKRFKRKPKNSVYMWAVQCPGCTLAQYQWKQKSVAGVMWWDFPHRINAISTTAAITNTNQEHRKAERRETLVRKLIVKSLSITAIREIYLKRKLLHTWWPMQVNFWVFTSSHHWWESKKKCVPPTSFFPSSS